MSEISRGDFIVTIRYSGERTLGECVRSVQNLELEYIIIETSPFWKAVVETFKLGVRENRLFTIGLDADIVLYSDALDKITEFVCSNLGFWRYDFALDDKFYPHIIWGTHVYSTPFLREALKHIPQNIDRITKPERQFYYTMKEAGFQSKEGIPIVVGRHGYDQYYFHIFNRFARRALRNPEHEDVLFKDKSKKINQDSDWLFAWLGWQHGRANRSKEILIADSENYVNIEGYLQKYGIPEKTEVSEWSSETLQERPHMVTRRSITSRFRMRWLSTLRSKMCKKRSCIP